MQAGVAIRSLLDYPADDRLGLAICPSFAQCFDVLLKVARLPPAPARAGEKTGLPTKCDSRHI
jgi:hypothetical protein